MPVKNKQIIIFLLGIAALFFTCQKDNLSVFEGNFYALKILYSANGVSTTRDTCDVVLKCYKEGDSLKILDFAFYIESEGQMVFESIYESGTGEIYSCQLTYTSDYERMELLMNGFEFRLKISGIRTSLPETKPFNDELDTLEGFYFFEGTNTINNQIYNISDTTLISRNDRSIKPININSNFHNFNGHQSHPHQNLSFYSYYHRDYHYMDYGSYNYYQTIHWFGNAVVLYKNSRSVSTGGAASTTRIILNGHKI